MKLTELSPRWILPSAHWSRSEDAAFYVGVSFLCPHCRVNRLAVRFWPPVDPNGLQGRMFNYPQQPGHQRVSGETFDTLTLAPSVGFDNIGHWHGHITAGECIGA